MTVKDGIVQIGYHHEDPKDTFAEVLNCLSHAMEGTEMAQHVIEHPGIRNAFDTLHQMIYEAFLLGELIDKMVFDPKIHEEDPDNKKICCPFHEEKTPSCVVSMNSGKFYCFSCEEEGDIHEHPEKFKELMDSFDNQLVCC